MLCMQCTTDAERRIIYRYIGAAANQRNDQTVNRLERDAAAKLGTIIVDIRSPNAFRILKRPFRLAMCLCGCASRVRVHVRCANKMLCLWPQQCAPLQRDRP